MSASPQKLSTRGPGHPITRYHGFGEALRLWLARADQNQEGLALTLRVHPSTITSWMHGRKQPDSHSLAQLLAIFYDWLHGDWSVADVLDAALWLGGDWHQLQRHLRRGIREAEP